MSNLRAVGQKVFIRPDKLEEKTASGIFLAQNHQHPPCSGVVVACGPGIHNRKGAFVPTELKPGDRVSYRWITAEQINSNVKWNGEDLKVMNADELVGLVEP
jgi:chaperonin GroES